MLRMATSAHPRKRLAHLTSIALGTHTLEFQQQSPSSSLSLIISDEHSEPSSEGGFLGDSTDTHRNHPLTNTLSVDLSDLGNVEGQPVPKSVAPGTQDPPAENPTPSPQTSDMDTDKSQSGSSQGHAVQVQDGTLQYEKRRFFHNLGFDFFITRSPDILQD